MTIVEIDKISKSFKNNVLYQDLTLNINKGETIGIVGTNGSGKSVLFKMIAGFEDVDHGKIVVRGKEVGTKHNFPINMGVLIDQPGYIEFYDGFTNLKLLAEIQNKIGDAQIRTFMRKLGLDPDDKTKVKNYSSGMKQKLGITQAIMEDQDLILLDEPFNALDFQTNVEVMKALTSLKDEGKTMVLTSHQHEYLEKICDKIYILIDGQLSPLTDKLKEAYFTIFK